MKYENWLNEYYPSLLKECEEACAWPGTKNLHSIFSRIHNSSLWSMLLWKEYKGYDAIKATLPGMPTVDIQRNWTGRSGFVDLGNPVQVWYDLFRAQFQLHSPLNLASSSLLDFGCGWGSLLRYFTKDIPSDALFGCDPHPEIIKLAPELNPYVQFARSDSLPKRLPFERQFDFVIATSIWTHLSERASEMCLDALYASMRPNGLLLMTIRPPDYQHEHKIFQNSAPIAETLSRDGFYFMPQGYVVDGVSTYGETIITMDYIRRKWADRFELIDVTLNTFTPASLLQVLLTLRRRQ